MATRRSNRRSSSKPSAGLIARALGWLGLQGRRRLISRHDAAQTTPENRNDWKNADDLAPDAAASPEVRRILRMRGRYQQACEPYIDGISFGVAASVIGNGPNLQMQTPDKAVNMAIERGFRRWAEAVRLAELLRLAVEARAIQGEAFLQMTSNPRLPTPVKLGLTLYEPDQVATPWLANAWDSDATDGIVFDRWNNPIAYHVLRRHPGDTQRLSEGAWEYDVVPAEDMLHFFRPRRPGQRRGVPIIASALPLSIERRGYRAAVLKAARVAAEMGAVVLESDVDPADDDDTVDSFDEIDIPRGTMTTLPSKMKAKQLQPTQPSTTMGEFDDRLVSESARPLQVPLNVAKLDSSNHNYASGRIDTQGFDRVTDVDHGDIAGALLKPILRRWLEEALLIPGYIPYRTRYLIAVDVPHEWLWQPRPHVDPAKEADGQRTRLKSRMTTITEEVAKEGRDPEAHFARLENETKELAKLGLLQEETLTGQQLTAAAELLARLQRGELVAEAAEVLLTLTGVQPAQAKQIVNSTIDAAKKDTPDPDAPEGSEEEPAPPATNGNGASKTNGVAGGRRRW